MKTLIQSVQSQKEEKQFTQKLKQDLVFEFTHHDKTGIYAKTQKMMAYNSNKIEGSTLTSEQTASLFDTGTIFAPKDMILHAKDVEEMTGHFVMFNHMVKTINDPLSEQLIKDFHKCLKSGMFEDIANGYPIGEYKNRANTVSDIITCLPKDVPEAVQTLLWEYSGKSEITVLDLAIFHAKYENIHPFQDGNGRTGRMILFKQCLDNDIIPIIIPDETKAKYYYTLHEAQINQNFIPLEQYFMENQSKYYEAAKDFTFPIEDNKTNDEILEKE